jgi:Ca-activated chloride channel family protein
MRPNRRSTLLTLLIAIIVPLTTASVESRDVQLTITGSVVHAVTGDPVPAAQVFVAELDVGVLSDQTGKYSLTVPIERVPAGAFQLTVQRIGFRQQTVTLHAPADPTTNGLNVDFRLEEQVLKLYEIIVTGAPSGTQRRAIGNTVSSRPTAASPQPTVTLSTAPPSAARAEAAAVAHGPIRTGGDGSREQYAHRSDSDFRSVDEHPRSTFSVDVDRASYANVRRFLLSEHRLPPEDAVLTEEMINYFDYDYDMPQGQHPVAVTTELGDAPWNPEHRLLRVGLATRPIVASEMPASNLVFLIDVSGSMSSPDKLPLVTSSLRLLVDQLRPRDRVAIVVYAGAAGLVLESTPGSQKSSILAAIDRLESGGSTAGGAGLRLAYETARSHFERDGNNRVILATDGDFNVGESSDDAMVRLVEQRRGEGTFLTVLGFGTGNLQFQKMQAIAQHGNGNFAYIDGIDEARRVLVGELGGTLVAVAKDVKVDLEFNPSRVASYRLVGYENRLLAAEDFNDDQRDAGDMGAGHRVTALYEVVLTDTQTRGVDPLRYQARPSSSGSSELAFVRVRYKRPSQDESRLLERAITGAVDRTSNDFRFAAAVAGFGMILRNSPYMGNLREHGARGVLALAEDALGPRPDEERREFVEMVRAYQVLSEGGRR